MKMDGTGWPKEEREEKPGEPKREPGGTRTRRARDAVIPSKGARERSEGEEGARERGEEEERRAGEEEREDRGHPRNTKSSIAKIEHFWREILAEGN